MDKLILAVDTATSAGGVSISKGTEILGEIYLNMATTHSQRVLKTIDILLKELNIRLDEFELFVSSIGPGSFTGIRIGLSLLKGFSESLKIELVGVPTIDALAAEYKKEGEFVSFIEGRAGEIFFATFKKQDGILKRISEYSSADTSFLMKNRNNFGVFKSRELLQFAEKGNLFAHNFSKLAVENYDEYKKNNVVPLYIKDSDAEINFKIQSLSER
jgi:tRNA threonylcarbamoyladenosine biosynthesis protein TsaB